MGVPLKVEVQGPLYSPAGDATEQCGADRIERLAHVEKLEGEVQPFA